MNSDPILKDFLGITHQDGVVDQVVAMEILAVADTTPALKSLQPQ